MLQTKPLTVQEQLNKAKEYMNDHNQTQLMVSIVEKVDYIDPIRFFKQFQHEDLLRLFWKDTEDSFYLVGIDEFKIIKAEADRFNHIRKQRQELLEQIYTPNGSEKGTGPVMLGGFSFNDTIHGDKWSSFESGLMVVPKAMLTVDDGECFMTYNVTIETNTNVKALNSELKQYTRRVYSKDETKMQQLKSTNSLDYRNWDQLINNAVESINNGLMSKVVLARELEAEFNQPIDVNDVLNRLVEQQTDSYIYIFDQGEDVYISSTPERLVKVDHGELLSTCLAGTIKRGQTADEDHQFASQLMNDEKNRNEHQYVVNMIKESIEPLSYSINIPNQPEILPLRTMQHLYTPVTAVLNNGYTIFDLMEKLHPTPALGGEPREVAMDFIEEHEPFERGWYAAPVGWVDQEGNGEIAVAIRSALINDNKATLFAGCGIVAESDPHEEYEETKLKFTPMLEALGGISQ